jgi:putative membrane protein
MMIVFWGAVISLIVWAVRGFGLGSTRTERDPKDILAERFARGEISEEEYEQRKRVLQKRAS